MRAIAFTLYAVALAAPACAASRAPVHPLPAETTVGFANPETVANGIGWKSFVHTVATDGGAHPLSALSSWAMMVGGFAGAGTLLRRRSSLRI